MTDNIYSLLLSAAEENNEKTFLTFHDDRITYGDVLASAGSLAARFLLMGVSPGDRVLVNLPNVPELVYALFASYQLGAIPVMVNPAARRHELGSYMDLAGPSLVLTHSENYQNFNVHPGFAPGIEKFLFVDDAFPGQNIGRIIAGSRRHGVVEQLGTDHPAFIIFTAAEDGVPGGAMITHRAIMETANLSGEMQACPDDVFFAALPLYHAFGLTTTLFLPLANRARVIMTERFSPRKTAEHLAAGEVTVFCGVPVMFGALSKVLNGEPGLSAVRAWISGGEAVSRGLQESMKSRLGIEIRQGYGLTEASPIVTWNSLDSGNRHGSIGKPMPYNVIRLERNGKETVDGEAGEILVKGVNVIPGYYADPVKTAGMIRDGWLRTGDLAVRDSDGNYFIRGRTKEMVLRSGFNVYPGEVRRILAMHPGVDSVEVIGRVNILDDYSGRDSLEATVRRKRGAVLGEKEFRGWCADNISYYKIPDTIHVL